MLNADHRFLLFRLDFNAMDIHAQTFLIQLEGFDRIDRSFSFDNNVYLFSMYIRIDVSLAS